MGAATEKVLLAIGLLAALSCVLVVHLIVPRLAEQFQILQFDLPVLTSGVIRYFRLIWLAPLAVLLAWWLWPARALRGIAACVTGVVVSALVNPLVVFAMYVPFMHVLAQP